MKHNYYRTFAVMCAVVISIASFTTSHRVFAAGNKLFITPTSSQLTVGGTVNVNVKGYVESSTAVGSVSGVVTYPSAQLRVIGTSTTGSAYNNPNISVGGSTINFSGTKSPGPTGQVQVFTITFQAVGAGSATVGFSGESNLNQVATDKAVGSFTISNPAPTPTPTPTPTPSPTPTPTPTPTPSPTPTPTPTTETPTATADEEDVTTPDVTGLISSVNRAGEYKNMTLSWQLTSPGTAELYYGTASDKVTTKIDVTKGDGETFSAKINDLTPGTRYFFNISAKGEGNKMATYSGTFSTLGYPVTLKITQAGSPAVNAKIQLGQQQYATSKDGTSTLALAANQYNAVISVGDQTKSVSFTVDSKEIPTNGSPETQEFSFDVPLAATTEEGGGFSLFAFIGVMVAGVALVIGGFLVFVTIKRRRYETDAGYSNQTPTTSVIIDDGYDWRHDESPSTMTQQPDITPVNAPTVHSNSVYLEEEEPLDMFEQAKKERTMQSAQSSNDAITLTHPADETQIPNRPHSTTP
jgi:hypothetical protein